jgi:recombination protein RecA
MVECIITSIMGNTVGSLELPSSVRVRKHMVLEVSDFQKQVLIGCMLGDAYITRLGKIRIEHSEKQHEYVVWKYNALRSLLYNAEPRKMVRIHNVLNVPYTSYRFSSRQYFKSWRDIWYPCGIKVFPSSLVLTPLALAVWYMDDGCWTGKKVLFAIEGFSDESQCRIQRALHTQYGIETLIGKNRKLLVRTRSHSQFFTLIVPYIIPSMRYKIPNPVTTGFRVAADEDSKRPAQVGKSLL